MNIILQSLTQQHDDKEYLPVAEVAKTYFNLSSTTFKKKLKQGEISEVLKNSIVDENIPISALATVFSSLRGDDLNYQAKFNDNLTRSFMIGSLIESYGSAFIPYQRIAAQLFGWNEGTAKARLKSGEVSKLGLKTISSYQGAQSPVFVFIGDILDFIFIRRDINISESKMFQ